MCSALWCEAQGLGMGSGILLWLRAVSMAQGGPGISLAVLEPDPAWSLCPAVGFLPHPSITVSIDIYISMQIVLSPGLVFVYGNLTGLVRTVVKSV